MTKLAFEGAGILLDIEGTTSSIAFVADVLFPFARRELQRYLSNHLFEPSFAPMRDLLARDWGQQDWGAFLAKRNIDPADREAAAAALRDALFQLMDADAKATGLKELQGRIWEAGYKSGELRSHVYPDVSPAIEAWNAAGIDVRIYSSGSVSAQKLFFAHTADGDMLQLFRGHYDTTIGAKREAPSYERIAKEFGQAPGSLLFLSDVVAELDAARSAGWRTGLLRRPGNAAPPAGQTHPELSSFAEIELAG